MPPAAAAADDWDYRNRPLPRWAYRGPTFGTVTLWLIAINVFVYLIDRILLRMGLRVTGGRGVRAKGTRGE